jgi:Ca-activated chloride channel family protein
MSGPPSEERRRAPSRLSPWLALTAAAGGAFAFFVATAEVVEITLEDLPDRYVRVIVPAGPSPDAEPEPVVVSLRQEDRPSPERGAPEAEAAAAAADQEVEAKEQVLHKSKLLAKLIGTSGESSTSLDLWSDEDVALGDVDAALLTTGAAGAMAARSPMGGGALPVPEPDPVSSGPSFEGEGFVFTHVDPLSTFSIDVDTGSWTRTVAQLRHGARPVASQVRVEEFVNAFRYDYDAPSGGRAFAVHAQAAPSPWDDELHLLRIGLQAAEVPVGNAPPVHLTFLIDSSCSMADDDKLPLVKRSLHDLVDRLRPVDSVAVVTYAGSSEVVLGRTSAGDRAVVHEAIGRLHESGGTAMADGVYTAYALASEALDEPVRWAGLQLPVGGTSSTEAVHRVVLVSDGDANVGPSDPQGILPTIRDHAVRGITLTSLGVGRQGYRDDMMERLADEGDGAYHFLASKADADRVLGRELTSTLHVVARDTKVQVAFDPDVVRRYRLVGYDNRRLLDRDFRDDAIDAGEVGSGHQVTAIYEVELRQPDAPLGEVRLRYKPPGPDAPSDEVVAVMGPSTVPSLAAASPSMRAAVAVAGLARVLRKEVGFGRARVPALEALAAGADVDPSRAEELGDVFGRVR